METTKTKALSLDSVERELKSELQIEKRTIISAEPFEYSKDGAKVTTDAMKLVTNENKSIVAPNKTIHNLPNYYGKGVECNVQFTVEDFLGEERVFIRRVEFPESDTKKLLKGLFA